MELTDEEISAALENAVVKPEQLVALMQDSGLDPSDDAIADIRRLATRWELDVEVLLYGLTSEDSPIFQDDDFWGERT